MPVDRETHRGFDSAKPPDPHKFSLPVRRCELYFIVCGSRLPVPGCGLRSGERLIPETEPCSFAPSLLRSFAPPDRRRARMATGVACLIVSISVGGVAAQSKAATIYTSLQSGPLAALVGFAPARDDGACTDLVQMPCCQWHLENGLLPIQICGTPLLCVPQVVGQTSSPLPVRGTTWDFIGIEDPTPASRYRFQRRICENGFCVLSEVVETKECDAWIGVDLCTS